MPRKLAEIVFFVQSNTRRNQVEYGLFRKGVKAELEGIQTVAVAVVRIIKRYHVRQAFELTLLHERQKFHPYPVV